jgi:DNA polymerase elongation subunit (family B)
MMNVSNILGEIKGFLEGYNDLKYIVNVETDPRTNIAECIIHEPGKNPEIRKIEYMPFMYMKDLSIKGFILFPGKPDEFELKKHEYGITITQLKAGKHKRLKNGFTYKISSCISYNAIINFLRDGGVYPYEKLKNNRNREMKDERGNPIYLYRDLYYSIRLSEQFFISTGIRLYKGFEDYKDINKVTFDIETTGLRYETARVFAIGVRNNKGFEIILEVDKFNDDESEMKLIENFFDTVIKLQPAIISGFNSEDFDFNFILGRAGLLRMNLNLLLTSLKANIPIFRRPNVSLKYGGSTDKFTATEMWGISVIDILHAVKRTAAVNSEIKENKLKYIAKFEKIARPNRTYIPGEDNAIGRYYKENKIFIIDENNNYLQIPDEFQDVTKLLYEIQVKKTEGAISEREYKIERSGIINENQKFVVWFKENVLLKGILSFIKGKDLVKQYLLDDLWETEQVDELYNQSSFMLAKIVPTTYQRICTMGTASIWNLLMTAWSYENDLAIPYPDVKEKFSGGLARCFKTGYSRRLVKIDYASLYPMLQLTWDIFPMFDVTGVLKKMLLYFTTTRNIYKKLANNSDLNEEEIGLSKEIDHDVYHKLMNNEITDKNRAKFKVKQLPIKILNNSLFGALGSDISFNWSDNICAARITCCGRLELRHAITWYKKYNCIALLAVTDGVNFQIPDKTNIRITDEGESIEEVEGLIEEMWKYGGSNGINALIKKFNKEEMRPPYMSVDNDGEFISCLNLSRINYATLLTVKDKKTGDLKEKVKLTGNTIKSKIMPGYIEDFIDKGFELILHGKGEEFFEYYKKYVDDICTYNIPLMKIASKSRIKTTIAAYKNRGVNKNGREKGKQAYMELLIEERNRIALELFEKYKSELKFNTQEKDLTDKDKMLLVSNYMPPEPELDSFVYFVNTGTKKSQSSSSWITETIEGVTKERLASQLIENDKLSDTLKYNVEKYLGAFNSRVKTLLVGFDPSVRKIFLSEFKITKETDEFGKVQKNKKLMHKVFTKEDLTLKNFDDDIFEEAMVLEPKESIFWNKSGYDPRLVWNGFTMNEDNEVYFKIYEDALNYFNDLMIKSNNPKRIKSINDSHENGDLVLIKDGDQYQVGKFNGICIEPIKDANKPKTEFELEIERVKAEKEAIKKAAEEERKKLEDTVENEKRLKAQERKRQKYFREFKKEFGIPAKTTMEKLFAESENAEETFNKYVENKENPEYVDIEEYDTDDTAEDNE